MPVRFWNTEEEKKKLSIAKLLCYTQTQKRKAIAKLYALYANAK